jgi:glycosyltransferase involved in cell wall biosynthesis
MSALATDKASERTTVIVPTFNRAALVVETLNSLFAQTLPPGEIIVIDDGSTDDTPQRMAEFGDRIRYIRKANSGKADSLNRAIALAQHPLVWIVDDDDLAEPGALAAMTALLDGRPEIGLAYGRYLRFAVDPSGARRTWDCGYWRETDADGFLNATLEDFFVHHPGMLVRRTAYEAVGPFSQVYPRLEDYEMLVRLARKHAVARTDTVIFLQRQHDGLRHAGLAADKRVERWVDEQRDFFTTLRETLPLTEYLPRNRQGDSFSPALEREALIARAVVMARKDLWTFAIQDLVAASRTAGAQQPLQAREHAALRRILFSKYGIAALLADPAIATGLRNVAKSGPVGRAIARVIARSLIYFVRTRLQAGKLAQALAFGRLALSLS